MKQLVIFASGAGTNAENIIRYFSDTSKKITVQAILSNSRKAGVLDKADAYGIPAFSFNREVFERTTSLLALLKSLNPNLIVLAGFLWKFPKPIIDAFPGKIINIHPALLPKYGGKGMYGMRIHAEVVKNKESKTGITIHYINEAYDEGAIIFQATTAVLPGDTPENVAQKVHSMEYEHFPKIIELLLNEKL